MTPQPEDPRRKTTARLIGVAAFAALALPLVIAVLERFAHRADPTANRGDQAAMQLDVMAAEHLHLLVGAYSRYGWNHPGPLMLYLYVPFGWRWGVSGSVLSLATAAVNLVTFLALAVLLRRAADPWHQVAGAVVLVFVLHQFGILRLTDPWNPFTLVLPLALVGVAVAVAAAGRPWALPVAVVAGSAAAQAHLGAAPLAVGWIALGTGVVVGTHRHRLREVALPVGVAIGVGVLCWLPPAYQQVTRHPGNLTRIQESRSEDLGTKPTFEETREDLVVPLTLDQRPVGDALGYSISPIERPTALATWHAIGLVVVAAAGAVRRVRSDRDRLRRATCATAVVGVGISVLASMQIIEPAYRYLFTPVAAAGIVLHLAVAFVVVDLLGAATRHLPGPLPRWRTTGAAAVAAIVGLVFWVGAVRDAATIPPYAQEQNSTSIPPLTALVRDAMPCDARQVWLEMAPFDAWTEGAGVAVLLERDGVEVTVGPRFEPVFGEAHRRRGDEQTRVLIARPGQRIPAGADLVGIAPKTGLRVYAIAVPGRAAPAAPCRVQSPATQPG